VTASASTAGTTTLLVSPGPGLGLSGTVSFTCSGLSSPATCSVQPAQLILDGFTSATAKVTISKSGTQGTVHVASHRRQHMLSGPIVALTIVFVFLLGWIKQKRYVPVYALVALSSLGGIIAGCSSSSSSTPPPSTSAITGTSTVVTVTASGGFGPDAVSHSVTLVVTFQ
jgi:hypothetical protein